MIILALLALTSCAQYSCPTYAKHASKAGSYNPVK